ncbi:hypothetical protein HN51_001165 [Arachis hypogaea]
MKILILKFLQFVLLLIFYGRYTIAEKTTQEAKKTYIVHMDKFNMPKSFSDHLSWYDSSLKSVSDSEEMLYTYNHVAHEFSIRLTFQEAETLSKQLGILYVMPEVRYELHTTRTPQFLGLDKATTLFPASKQQSQVVIRVLDTGVWPELQSLDDTGLGPVLSGWKGECEIGTNFNSSSCNRKLVGARFFTNGYEVMMPFSYMHIVCYFICICIKYCCLTSFSIFL